MSWQGPPLQVNMHTVCSRWTAGSLQVTALTDGVRAPGCLVQIKVQVAMQKCSEGGGTGHAGAVLLLPE